MAISRALSEQGAGDRLIAHYLRQLRVAAWIRQLSRAETTAIENEVGTAIAAELVAAGNHDESTVYAILDRLGPAGDIVARRGATPPTGLQGAVTTLLAPVTRSHAILRSRGWGAAEIGGLLLLIVGPFYLWWLGPFFGISLVRVAADRWTHRATHIATVVIVVLFSVQVLMALAVFALLILRGGSAVGDLQQLFSVVMSRGLGGPGLAPPTGTSAGLALSPVEMAFLIPAPLAGLLSGVYLALSPRHRP